MIFECHTQQEHANALAAYLPNGPLFQSKVIEGTNLRNLLFAFAAEFLTFEQSNKEFINNHDPAMSTLLITEWERAVGIPDDCFSTDVPLNERRRNVIIKLATALDTEQSYLDLAALLGISPVTLTYPNSGAGQGAIFPLDFPIEFFSSAKNAKFTLIINLPALLDPCIFPIPFPVCFSGAVQSLIECLYNKLKPANALIIFRYIL